MAEIARGAVTSELAESGRARILVVDDSPLSRAHLLQTLSQLAEISAVESRVQALGALRNGGYALVLCDYEMPDMRVVLR